jgi:hypothetical protein
MTDRGKHTERRFEDAIQIELCARGYDKGSPDKYDAERALFPHDVIDYIRLSQAKKWQSFVDLQGNAAEGILLDALVKELAANGVLHVLRHGFKCFGKTFTLAAFRPASGMNPETIAAYKHNIVRITRQVKFNPGRRRITSASGCFLYAERTAADTHSFKCSRTSSIGKKVTTALNGPSRRTTSVSCTVVLAVDVGGNRSFKGSVPIICRSSVVFPAPVVPSKSAERYSLDFEDGSSITSSRIS